MSIAILAAAVAASIGGLWLFIRIILRSGGVVDPRHKAVLITGCDTGFGNALATRLHGLGFTVFAGCLDAKGDGATQLSEDARTAEAGTERSGARRMRVLQMDICKDTEVTEAVRIVKHSLRKDEVLWAVVNNAGLSTFGEVEWCGLDVFQRLADVNIWGGVRVVKSFLPLIRKSHGRIVQMTSGLGRQAILGRSCYVLTKYAMEGFAQSLRYEMKRWGVHVSIIEPGNFVAATGIFTPEKIEEIAQRMWGNASEETKRAYGQEQFQAQVHIMSYYSRIGTTDTSPVVNAMVAAVRDRRPKIRYEPKDPYWKARTFVMTILPQEVGDWIYH